MSVSPRRPLWILVFAAMTLVRLAALDAQPVTQAEQELRRFAQSIEEMLNARDRSALEHILADGFEFLHSTGRVESRESFLKRASEGTLASQRNPGEQLERRLRIYNDVTALWTVKTAVRLPQPEGPPRDAEFITLYVYVKTGTRWEWVSAQSTSVRPPGTPE